MNFPTLPDDLRARRLMHPTGNVKVVLDTDIANEIDDPFAMAHLLLSPEQVDVQAITIAPYAHRHVSVTESQPASLELGRRTLDAIGVQADLVSGATRFTEGTPVESEAVERILAESKGTDPLYILAIGAATNVASALLIDPTLVERAVVVWLGGHSPELPWNDEYNLKGDLFATQVLFASGVPLVHYPAMGVTSHLLTSAVAAHHDLGSSSRGAFFINLLQNYYQEHFAREKEIWDIGVTSYVVNPDWTQFVLEPTPAIADDCRYVRRPGAPLCKRATYISRNDVIPDLFRKMMS